ncbi:pyruvate kinase [Rhizobium oryzicola]|uniref:Pyruvate kinase n=1 Tax=Rhizobium oryzicola TaxID=1232668 RepID=A0ABT8SVP8_9HYPH|nr:pyruvate kinase [Rhizobium oryzicola]MDO1582111.1 pyruvate kinase [Rhizobium oryzicola]
MLQTAPQSEQAALSRLMDELRTLRDTVEREAQETLSGLIQGASLSDDDRNKIENLARYLALRSRDVRPLQRRLMALGFSSLGRIESRVQAGLDAVLASLAPNAGAEKPYPRPTEEAFFQGEALLDMAAAELLGPSPANRRGRIMVTLPSEAADDPDFILELTQRGMNVARINCAHDDRDAWLSMADHVRKAAQEVGREIPVLMDIAGPKIRTETVLPAKIKLHVGDLFRLVTDAEPELTDDVQACASVSVPEIVTRLSIGDRIRYDDGKLEGIVEGLSRNEAVVRVNRARAGGAKLKPEKGLNLPDTSLGLSPLTAKDEADLATVVECADMIGYSFVSRPQDIDLLETALASAPAREKPLGLVAKIEHPEAVHNLPALIATAFRYQRPFGVMIARGDLAAELGFERVAEMQEEILWICEAASVPTIWATQVLEDLVKNGLPSRGEMTDAAMAARAECVMLNKGPAVAEAVEVLDHLLARMDEHIFKKTSMLRALKSWLPDEG